MKRAEDFLVLHHKWLNYKTFIIEIEASADLPLIHPGNFAELAIINSPNVFLRRPFSVYDVDYERRTISFFVKVVGEGTRILGDMRQGDKLNMIYPLGNSFTVPEAGRVLVVAGGSGVAPFILYAKELQRNGVEATFLFGAKNADDILLTEQFGEYGNVLVTTEDGSLGEKGLVTQHSLFSDGNLPFDLIVTCGPDPMMKAVARLAEAHEIPCEISLENTMACGIGACLCCVVETIDGNKTTCIEGPVFDTRKLKL